MKRIVLVLLLLAGIGAVSAQEKKYYNEEVDAMAQIQTASMLAKQSGRYVLCQVGGNWCPWCIRFANFATTDSVIAPLIERNFRVIPDKGHRSIAGLSMGGGGSFYYGCRHADMFSSVYAISAAVGSFASPNARPQRMAGGVNQNIFQANVDLENVPEEQLAQMKTVAWTLDCGDDDFLFAGNVQTYQQMKKLGMNIQFRTREGVHATRHFSDQCK